MKRRFFKGFISLLLILSVAVSMMIFPVSAEESTVALDETEFMKSESLGFLAAAGIISAYDDGTYDLWGEFTRADLAVQAIRMLGENESELTSNTYFTDVPNYHWAASSIEKLLGYGIISADETYRPDDAATMMEVCKVMVCLAGYESLAEANGGYPAGYQYVANRLGFLTGISSSLDAPCSRIDAFEIIYKAMTTEMMEKVAYGNPTSKYDVTSNTILSIYHNIMMTEDRVNGVWGISLDDGEVPERDRIKIGNVMMKSDNISDEDSFLGRETTCYYTEDEKGVKSVVYLYSDDELLTINADDILSYSNYSLQYSTESDKIRKISVPESAIVIKNGELISQNINSAFDIDYGTITFIENGGKYEIVIIEEIETIVCGSVDRLQGLIYGENSEIVDASDTPGKVVKIYQDGGFEVSLDDIKMDSLLSVMRSDNYVEICVSTLDQIVTIGSLRVDDRYAIIEADGVEYRMLYDCYVKNKVNIKPGNTISLKFNIFGIAGNIGNAGEDVATYGYLYMISGNTSGFSKSIVVKMYTSAGEIKDFFLAEKVTVDGYKYDINNLNDYDAIINLLDEPQIIVYKEDENGNIKWLDSAEKGINEDDNSLERGLKMGSHSFIPWKLFLTDRSKNEPLSFVEDTTMVVVRPPDEKLYDAKAKDFRIQAIKKEITWQWKRSYQCETYRFDRNGVVEDVVVMMSGTNPKISMDGGSNRVFIVKNFVELNSEDGDIIHGIEAVDKSGAIVTYTMYENAKIRDQRDKTVLNDNNGNQLPVEPGDCILAEFQNAGEISKIEVIYDANANNNLNQKWVGSVSLDYRGALSDDLHISSGYVSKFYDDYVTWSYAMDGEDVEGGKTTDIAIVICELKNGTFYRAYKGSAADLRTYEYSGKDCSRIIAQSYQGNLNTIVVIEEV